MYNGGTTVTGATGGVLAATGAQGVGLVLLALAGAMAGLVLLRYAAFDLGRRTH
jgi:hypothetical protein